MFNRNIIHMDITKLVIFLHVYTAMGLFASMTLEYRKLIVWKRLFVNGMGDDLTLKNNSKPTMIFMLLALFTGIYLMISNWGPAPWMTIALISLGLLIMIGLIYLKRTKLILQRSVQEHTSIRGMNEMAVDNLLASIKLRLAIASGIIALMTVKPSDLLSGTLIEILFFIIGYLWVLQRRF